MTPNFRKYLKIVGEILGIFILGFFALSFAGRYLIEEISQPVFISSPETEQIVLEAGKIAPYFELHNINGKLVKFTDYKNVPVVLVFWNTWSSISQNQIKIIDEMLKKEDLFFKVITINSQEDRKVVSSFIKRGLYSRPEILLDFNGSVSDLYEARNLPTFYFIDKDGVIKDIKLGILGEQEIVDNISKYLK